MAGSSSGGKPIVHAQEQTHNTAMSAQAAMTALATGNDYIGKAVEGMADAANRGSDGVAVFAAMGGGTGRQETGSYVKADTWNGILAVGTSHATGKGSIQWGGFAEHGSASYSLHSDTGYGSGTAKYTGGGLMAKFTTKQDVYVEASFRAGRVHDTASDILRDALGNSYGYNVHTNYRGTHLGVGKVYRFARGRNLDIYAKFFLNRRGGTSFDAGGHYELDSVTSKKLRLGTRYSAEAGKGWNWYAGLAYEYEFDGEATGTADGVPIRASSTKGGSLLGEFGLHLEATEKNPWQADIGIFGSCGKHRGVGGAVSVAYRF